MTAYRQPGRRFQHLAMLVAGLLALSTASFAEEHQIYLFVMNQYGQPVENLLAEEVTIDHRGESCDVLSVHSSALPMTVALLIDDSDEATRSLNSLRDGLVAFLETLPSEHEVGLFTLSGQAAEVVGFTTDRGRLMDAARNLFGERGTGVVLLDGMVETWERRFDDDTSWPVFVNVVYGGAEASRSVRERQLNRFVAELRSRGATVHALLVDARPTTVQVDTSIFMTGSTGGLFRPLAATTALPMALTELAEAMGAHYEEVKHRYRVVFECDDDSPQRIRARVTRPAVAVRTFADRGMEQEP